MLSRRSVNGPAILSLAAVFVMGIMLLGGCPQQQIPTPPPSQSDPNEPPPSNNGQNQQDRPIPPPVIEPDEPAAEIPDEEPGSGGIDPGGGTATWSVRFTSPLTAKAVRPGTVVDVALKLSDRQALVSQTELALARDDNGDGEPDGSPVWTRPVSLAVGNNAIAYNTAEAAGLLSNGYGQFVIGVRVTTKLGTKQTSYAPGRLTIDAVPPTVAWVSPTENKVTSPTTWNVKLQTSDNSKHTVRVLLDTDTNPTNGYAGILVEDTEFAAGAGLREFNKPLSISSGTYYYYVVVSDGVDPPTAMYAPNLKLGGAERAKVLVTRRLIASKDAPFDLNRLDPSSPLYTNYGVKSQGAILRGFNFNDLAGSSMVGVPDVDADGHDELLIVSRFGKPRYDTVQGVGWGEAYMILGAPGRLRNPQPLNAVGKGLPGLIFTGIRAPSGTTWSEGLSDVTIVPDMDGDRRADLVFSFPRVESISLGDTVFQHPDARPYVPAMGAFEYNPIDDVVDTVDIEDPFNPGTYFFRRADLEVQLPNGTWLKNRTQFTRGGLVIVSSRNAMVANRNRLNFKGNRIVDLHEVGQMFSDMRRDEIRAVIEDASSVAKTAGCGDPPTPTEYEEVTLRWDLLMAGQGPSGFHNRFTNLDYWDPLNPPVLNMWNAGWSVPGVFSYYLDSGVFDPCDQQCVVLNAWAPQLCDIWPPAGPGPMYFPQATDYPGAPNRDPAQDSGFAVWSGFCGRWEPFVSPDDTSVGARVLGQRVNTRFGTAVAADDTWLYMSAPQHSAMQGDVPGLGLPSYYSTRSQSGVVYMYRTNAPAAGGVTGSQLWIEPGNRRFLDPNQAEPDPNDPNSWVTETLAWPYVDVDRLGDPNEGDPRDDYTDHNMPVPHTFIIEDIGYVRGTDVFWEEEWTRLGFTPESYDPNDPPRVVDWPLSGLLATGCSTEHFQPGRGTVTGGLRPWARCESPLWPAPYTGAATGLIDLTPQIVGPHENARLSFVRSLGDIDGDTIADFAVGSDNVRSDIVNGTGPTVGAVFIIYGRNTGLEGDLLLENLARDISHKDRLAGIVLKGNPSGTDRLARVFDSAGDFNGDPFGDLVVGNETGSGGRGEAVVLLGSPWLQSPGGGWTIDQAMATGVGVRFVGEAVGDKAGANVSIAGDVDGDGFTDILVAAPGAAGGKGAVYLIYGSSEFLYGGKTISLSLIGTFDLPGAKFLGRNVGDALGAGTLVYGDQAAGNPNGTVYLNPDRTPVTVYSDGVVSIGDLDGDGKDDYAIGAVLADPLGRRDAGEVYVIYGSGD